MAIDNDYSTELEIIVVEPKFKKADAAIIWLHGLGADGSDFVSLTDQLGLPEDHNIRFLFPSAPIREVTINNFMRMRAWYDIYSLTSIRKEDSQGIKSSTNLIGELITQEISNGVKSSNIILAGFSQGGAMALYTGLRFHLQLGGIISLSGYLPLASETSSATLSIANTKTPIFLAHGLFDPTVPFDRGQTSHAHLTQLAYNVQWASYPMQHTLCLEEINDIGDFIKKTLRF